MNELRGYWVSAYTMELFYNREISAREILFLAILAFFPDITPAHLGKKIGILLAEVSHIRKHLNQLGLLKAKK